MNTDRRIHTPGPRVGSGDPSSPVAARKTPSSSRRGRDPGAGDEESPAPAPPEGEEQEPEAVDLDALLGEGREGRRVPRAGAADTGGVRELPQARGSKEAAAAQERGAAKLALELLPAIDNLDRALAHAAGDENGDATFVAGIKHVRSDVLAALKRAGIEPLLARGRAV